ncbi:MAG: hypothetical protein Q7T18_10345 [Sedimentisphaerales bacterium]|nr:hypothetical protein [Sedimentisphaerales bacterium]
MTQGCALGYQILPLQGIKAEAFYRAKEVFRNYGTSAEGGLENGDWKLTDASASGYFGTPIASYRQPPYNAGFMRISDILLKRTHR